MKKLVNDPAAVVAEAVEGFAAAHPDLVAVSYAPLVVRRVGAPTPGRVVVVSGGGSGHEPLHTGFVGPGMLDAACPGRVFTSPTPDQVLAAAQAVDGGAGVLLVVKNYTGDVLNFETGAELAAAEGIAVATTLVADDVAVRDSLYTAGRRGVAGVVAVEKAAGAAAARGDDLGAVAAVADRVAAGVRTMGAALTAGTPPHTGLPSFDIGPDEYEFGVGIHGEPGRERRPVEPADAVVDRLLDAVLAELPPAEPGAGGRVLLIVNGLGGTPLSELQVCHRRAVRVLADRGLEVTRRLVGSYVTSFEMQGVSLSVLRLDDELTALWDAPVRTAALRWGC